MSSSADIAAASSSGDIKVKAEPVATAATDTKAVTASSAAATTAAGKVQTPTPPEPPFRKVFPGAKAVSHARVAEARAAVAVEPYDSESWSVVLSTLHTLSRDAARALLERFLDTFPTSGRYWKYYIDQEMAARQFSRCEVLFKRCLLQCMHMDLWTCYLRYIKIVKHGAADELQSVETAYEFVVEHMGCDLDAAKIWSSYVNFLKAVPAQNAYEESQKTSKIRSVYQRAVVLPLANVDILWREYDVFENELNKEQAKAILSSLQSHFFTANATARERKKLMSGVMLNMVARPPLPRPRPFGQTDEEAAAAAAAAVAEMSPPSSSSSSAAAAATPPPTTLLRTATADEAWYRLGNARACQQLALWKRYCDYIRSNPQRLDPGPHKARVMFAYRQALLTLRHYPEMWLAAATFLHGVGASDEAASLFAQATAAMPYSIVAPFMYAEFEEARSDFTAAQHIYEALLPALPSKSKKQSKKEKKAAAAAAAAAKTEDGATPADADSSSSSSSSSSSDTTTTTPAPQQQHVDPLVFIQYMRFARRCLGSSEARKVFLRARKLNAVTHHSFVAAAEMEYHCNHQPDVADRIFAKGFETHHDNATFVLHYLDYLKARNDHTNMRVVFEKVLPRIPPVKCKAIVDRLVEFERVCGDLPAITRAEERRAKVMAAIEADADERRLLAVAGASGAAADATADASTTAATGVEGAFSAVDDDEDADADDALDPSQEVLAMLDRYRFLDYWPCTPAYRQSLDTSVSESIKLADQQAAADLERERSGRGRRGGARGSSLRARQRARLASLSAALKHKFVRPQTSSMLQLRPGTGLRNGQPDAVGGVISVNVQDATAAAKAAAAARAAAHDGSIPPPVPGADIVAGVVPASLMSLCTVLPSPVHYCGPSVNLDVLVRILATTDAPTDAVVQRARLASARRKRARADAEAAQEEAKRRATATANGGSGAQNTNSDAFTVGAQPPSAGDGGGDGDSSSSGGGGGGGAAPEGDVYRSRRVLQ